MPAKTFKNQADTRRKPLQARALGKIELILEAATRILDKEGLAALTTNRVAEVAGISIGTLYQYFSRKEDILAMLSQREMQATTAKIMALLSSPERTPGQTPAQLLIKTVFGAFGGRSRVHRVLLEHALAQGTTSKPDAPPNLIAGLLSSTGVQRMTGEAVRFSPAEAFVLTQAFAGVTRATIGGLGGDIPRADIEEALLKLVQSFMQAPRKPQGVAG